MQLHLVLVSLLAGCAASTAAPAPDAPSDASPDAPPAPPLAEALDCGMAASAGGLPQGTDLQRVDVDLAAFPSARCNDGTPATFYFRPAATAAGSTRWVIQLQGGGSCRDADDCARRWCSVDTNFGMTQMTSGLAPDGIEGTGILQRGGGFANPLADTNQVFVRYCSSDAWAGRAAAQDLDAKHPVTGAPVRYRIEFEGQNIIDAVIATLRRDGAAPPAYTQSGGSIQLADLDDASAVVLAGASAGGTGAIHNVDRIGDTLRANNVGCAAGDCVFQYFSLIDSAFGPSNESLDWTTSTTCAITGACTWKDVLAAGSTLFEVHGDASCESWHAANAPDTAYLCGDPDHVVRHHVTTPMIMRQGLTDKLLSANLIATGASVPGRGPMTLALFAELVQQQLIAFGSLATSAEEGAGIAKAPATFGPSCADHETLSTNPAVYTVTVESAGTPFTMFDVGNHWFAGTLPQQVVYRPGDPVNCGPSGIK